MAREQRSEREIMFLLKKPERYRLPDTVLTEPGWIQPIWDPEPQRWGPAEGECLTRFLTLRTAGVREIAAFAWEWGVLGPTGVAKEAVGLWQDTADKVLFQLQLSRSVGRLVGSPHLLNHWIVDVAGLRPGLGAGPQLGAQVSGRGLRGLLGYELVRSLYSHHELTTCSFCGQLYLPRRAPARGRNHFCQVCAQDGYRLPQSARARARYHRRRTTESDS